MSDVTLTTASIGELAQRFVEATVDRVGTDEQAVSAILAEVHRRGATDAFERTLGGHAELTSIAEIPGSKGIVPTILGREMSGTELSCASDIWESGSPSFSDSGGAYVLQGFINGFADVGELFREHPIVAAGATVVGGSIIAAGMSFAAPATAVGLGVLTGGALLWETGKSVYHGVMAATEDDRARQVGHLVAFGESLAGVAMASPAAAAAVKPSVQGARTLKTAARATMLPRKAVTTTAVDDDVAMEILSTVRHVTLGKKELNAKLQSRLASIASSSKVRYMRRKEALRRLEDAGVFSSKTSTDHIEILRDILLGKTRADALSSESAASFYERAIKIAAASDDPRALDILKSAYWKGLIVKGNDTTASGLQTWQTMIDDLGKVIIGKDPSFYQQQRLYSLGSRIIRDSATKPGSVILTTERQAEYGAILEQDRATFLKAVHDIATNPTFPDEVGQALYKTHLEVAKVDNGIAIDVSKHPAVWRTAFKKAVAAF